MLVGPDDLHGHAFASVSRERGMWMGRRGLNPCGWTLAISTVDSSTWRGSVISGGLTGGGVGTLGTDAGGDAGWLGTDGGGADVQARARRRTVVDAPGRRMNLAVVRPRATL
jgi:hypothetical protein